MIEVVKDTTGVVRITAPNDEILTNASVLAVNRTGDNLRQVEFTTKDTCMSIGGSLSTIRINGTVLNATNADDLLSELVEPLQGSGGGSAPDLTPYLKKTAGSTQAITGDLYTSNILTDGDISATGNISAANLDISGSIQVDSLTADSLTVENEVRADNVHSNTLEVDNGLVAGSVFTPGELNAGTIVTTGNATIDGAVSAISLAVEENTTTGTLNSLGDATVEGTLYTDEIKAGGHIELADGKKLLFREDLTGTPSDYAICFVGDYANITDPLTGQVIPRWLQTEIGNTHFPLNPSHTNNPLTGKYIAYDVGSFWADPASYPGLSKQVLATFTEGVLQIPEKYTSPISNGSGGYTIDTPNARDILLFAYKAMTGLKAVGQSGDVITFRASQLEIITGVAHFKYHFKKIVGDMFQIWDVELSSNGVSATVVSCELFREYPTDILDYVPVPVSFDYSTVSDASLKILDSGVKLTFSPFSSSKIQIDIAPVGASATVIRSILTYTLAGDVKNGTFSMADFTEAYTLTTDYANNHTTIANFSMRTANAQYHVSNISAVGSHITALMTKIPL